jgi:hypothetical protein
MTTRTEEIQARLTNSSDRSLRERDLAYLLAENARLMGEISKANVNFENLALHCGHFADENAKLRESLKPFAEAKDYVGLTLEHLRRARRALEGGK